MVEKASPASESWTPSENARFSSRIAYSQALLRAQSVQLGTTQAPQPGLRSAVCEFELRPHACFRQRRVRGSSATARWNRRRRLTFEHQPGSDSRTMTTYAQMSPGQSGSPHDSYSATESAGNNNNANNSSFFTSNHYYNASPSTSTALLPVSTSSQQPPPAQRSTQVFLPPLPPTRATSGDLGVGGATFLSDEETNASDSPVGASSYPPLTGATTRPRAARQSSVASSVSVDTVSGQPRAKGKGGGNGAGTNKKKGAAGAKRKQQIGPDGKPLPKKKKAGRACAACQKAHLTCDDGAGALWSGQRSR